MPPYRSIVPHIVPIIKAYRVNEKLYNVLGDVEDLYSWYYSLTKDLNKEPVEKVNGVGGEIASLKIKPTIFRRLRLSITGRKKT